MKHSNGLLLLGVLLLGSVMTNENNVYGQEISTTNKGTLQAHASFIDHQPNIDGQLIETEWQDAKVISDFIQVEPNQGKPSKFNTEIRLLYSDKAFYVGVYCSDPNGNEKLRAPDIKQDFAWRKHDTFAIAIDGFRDKRNSITFATNPYGAKKDYISFDDILYDSAWNGLWKVRTSRSDSGWVAEFEIPFKTLRYPDRIEQDWGINFLRLQRLTNEISVWSPYPRSFGFNRMAYAGILKRIEVPQPSSNVQVNPYLLSSNDGGSGDKSEYLQSTAFKPGGNIKWAITPNTVIDFTANTDFAQAEADIQVNNVSRFSVLFSEKRPFFLENASLFGAGLTKNGDGLGGNLQILPFFSRRIGLDIAGNPIPISAGIKAVHRSLKRNTGVLYMHQRSSQISPDKHVAVGRYSQNIGKQNRVGVLTTMSASPQENTMNWVGALDGFFRLDEEHSVKMMLMQSGYSDDRPSGFASYMQYRFTSNAFNAWWTQALITQYFDPELGFISRRNVIATTPGAITNFRRGWVPFKQFVRSFKPGIEMAWYHQASTRQLMERSIKLHPFWIELKTGGSARYSVSWSGQLLTADFHPLGITINEGKYNYRRHAFTISSDPSRSLSYTINHELGTFYDGRLTSTELHFIAAPIPHINLQFQFNRNRFDQVGVESNSSTINLYTLRSRFALNPQIQLTGLYQRNTKHNTNAFNARLSWEYKPMSYVYLVFNSKEFMDEEYLIQQDAKAIIKLTYLAQF
ncbi:MAG: DUF5916 domain-containing protein [Bacteroidota bacterium]